MSSQSWPPSTPVSVFYFTSSCGKVCFISTSLQYDSERQCVREPESFVLVVGLLKVSGWAGVAQPPTRLMLVEFPSFFSGYRFITLLTSRYQRVGLWGSETPLPAASSNDASTITAVINSSRTFTVRGFD